MAKQKTHDQLGITMGELIALQGVRSLLAGGNLKYHKYEEFKASYPQGEHVFNMGCPMRNDEHCGSIGCIGGYMAMALGEDPKSYVVKHDPSGSGYNGIFIEEPKRKNLGRLFYPPEHFSYNKVTVKQAIKAIDNYLTKGKALWAKIPGMKKDDGNWN